MSGKKKGFKIKNKRHSVGLVRLDRKNSDLMPLILGNQMIKGQSQERINTLNN